MIEMFHSAMSWINGMERSWLLPVIAGVSFVLSFIGAAVGLILGHLRLPLLLAYLGSPTASSATNLIISGSGAFAGAVRHLRAGRVSWVGLAVMGIPSAAGAIVAVLIFVRINPLWSFLVIGFMLVVSGINLIRKKATDPPPGQISLARRLTLEVIIGLVLGALAAITGLMLGSLRLPMMIKYLRMDPREAIGTNMAVGCLTGMVGAFTAYQSGTFHLNWLVLVAVIPPTVLGGYLGGWMTGYLSKEGVQKLAGWIITLSGAILLAQGSVKFYRTKPAELPPIIVYPTDDDDDVEDRWSGGVSYELEDDFPEEEL